MDLPLSQAKTAVPSRSRAQNGLLTSLAKEDRAALSERLEAVDFPLGSELITANHPIDYAYFPLSGLVSTVVSTVRPSVEIGVIGREGMVGLPAVLGSDRCPYTFVVQSAGHGLRIGIDALRIVMQERPALLRTFGLFAHVQTVQVSQTAYANAILTIESRLARWFLMTQDRLDSDEVTLTHKFLAIMLGVRRASVTMAIHALEGAYAIRATRGHIFVRDRAKLMEFAGDSYGLAEAEYERLFPAA